MRPLRPTLPTSSPPFWRWKSWLHRQTLVSLKLLVVEAPATGLIVTRGTKSQGAQVSLEVTLGFKSPPGMPTLGPKSLGEAYGCSDVLDSTLTLALGIEGVHEWYGPDYAGASSAQLNVKQTLLRMILTTCPSMHAEESLRATRRGSQATKWTGS